MSTYLSTFNKRKGTGLSVWASYCVLSGLLTLLMLFCTFVLSPIALGARKDSTQPEYLLRAGVAVVRVVATYNALPSPPTNTKHPPSASVPPSPVSCTGLGVVVASWSGSATERNTYILTDGSLVNKQELTCGTIPTTVTPLPGMSPTQLFRLSQIRVYYSTAYTPTIALTTLNNVNSVVCGEAICSDGAALFSFHSATPLPLVAVAANNNASLADAAALQLNISSSKIATPSAASDSQQFLAPTSLPLTSSNLDALSSSFEGGTPIVDAKGTLNKLYLKNGTTVRFARPDDIRDLMDSQKVTTTDGKHANPVNDAWQSGMNAYVLGQQHYTDANKDFQQAYRASNSQFQGAQTLVDATNPGSQQGNTTSPGTNGESNAGITIPLIGSVPYLLLAIGAIGLVILILLLIVLNLIFRRAQSQKEQIEVDKQATIEAQHIRKREAQQATASAAPPGAQPLSQQSTPSYAAQQMSNSTASIPPSLVPLAPASATSIQSSAVADQPTIDLSEARHNGTLDVDKTQPYSPIMQPATNTNNSEEHVGFEIIAKTNPGIKRQHKPNEDSMFAIRGMRNENGQAQQIGLFVVADGMGGHADGQDASRLAIQTIIDYLLPRLSQGEDTRESAQKLLVESIQLANQAVHQHNVEQNADMGTTVTATLVIDEMAHVANVGDSRTYVYRVSDGLTRVTRDHSVVASLVDAGIIKPDDIYTHPKRNQIYRSLGEKPFVEVDPFTVQLHPGDKLLLCSDGLWEMVRDPEIQRVLEMPTSNPQQLGENLISAALKSGGEDNVSVMVVNVVDQASITLTSGLEPVYVQDNIKIPSL